MANEKDKDKNKDKLHEHPEKAGEAQRIGSDEPTVEEWTGAVSTPQPVPPKGQKPLEALVAAASRVFMVEGIIDDYARACEADCTTLVGRTVQATLVSP